MTDRKDASTPDSVSGAPIDFDRHEVIRDRLATDEQFTRIDEQPGFVPDRLVCTYDSQLYPGNGKTAQLEITWFENGDFSLHYHEKHDDGPFDHRWDRHPSSHNARDHAHPGPDAPTPGDDTSHPPDWRDVISIVLTAIEERQRAFWDGCQP